jgi:phasin family protein
MTKQTTNAPFPNLFNLNGFSAAPAFDVDAVVAFHRKNFEAVSQVNQIFAQGVQAVGQRAAELLQQVAAEAPQLLRELTQVAGADELVAKQIELAKQGLERTVANTREFAALASTINTEATDVLGKRAREGFDEIRGLAAAKRAA